MEIETHTVSIEVVDFSCADRSINNMYKMNKMSSVVQFLRQRYKNITELSPFALTANSCSESSVERTVSRMY